MHQQHLQKGADCEKNTLPQQYEQHRRRKDKKMCHFYDQGIVSTNQSPLNIIHQLTAAYTSEAIILYHQKIPIKV